MPASNRRAVQRKAAVEGRWRKPPLSVLQIVAWADHHHQETGRWPNLNSGRVRCAREETWKRIDRSLRHGVRGLQRGDSLARVLARYRGVRNRKALPPLGIEDILKWADGYHARHKGWPNVDSGPIDESPGDTWCAVDAALWQAQRGLPGGSSLARLLDEHRDVRNIHDLPRLSTEQILKWGDAYFALTRAWPTAKSGTVVDAPGETWLAIDLALRRGARGLPANWSLSRLWKSFRHRPKWAHGRMLTEEEVLVWADVYHARHGAWPNPRSGKIQEASDLDWRAINTALRDGYRGLLGGSSLPQFLLKHRGVRSQGCAPPLTVAQILYWADAHRFRTGNWPNAKSGRIAEAPEETWGAIQQALIRGYRDLPIGFTLATFLDRYRRNKSGMLSTK